MKRYTYFVYGGICYLMFLGVFFYAIGFIGNFDVPTTLNGEPNTSFTTALLINLILLAVFAIQHSLMARPWFKSWWTQFVPRPIERSTYVLFSNIAMILLFGFWQPLGGMVWNVTGVWRMVLYGLYAMGWATVLYATCLVNHFDLFGMRQVWLYLKDKPYSQLPFREPSLYRYVRHPLYVGWIIVFWFTPTMSLSNLLFAIATTGYILLAIQFEERDLINELPGYAEYRRRVPMLVPSMKSQSPDYA